MKQVDISSSYKNQTHLFYKKIVSTSDKCLYRWKNMALNFEMIVTFIGKCLNNGSLLINVGFTKQFLQSSQKLWPEFYYKQYSIS